MFLQPISIFTPAGSASGSTAPGGGVIAMPAVDGSNLSTSVANGGPEPVCVAFGGTATLPVLPFGSPGGFRIEAGQTVLLPAPYAAFAAAATYVAVSTPREQASLTITRGTVSAAQLFAA